MKFSFTLYDSFKALCNVSAKKYIIYTLEERNQSLNGQIKGTKPALIGLMC